MTARAYFEDLELKILSPIAVKAATSKGRRYDEPPSSNRTCFQRDRDRIIHAKAFRRLKHKTQVFIATESDHYRSRLTHTLEVAQISRHLARLLRVNEDLSEAIALAHDLGHTPFGHSGERELNLLMKDFGGFEHNLQSRRIVDQLETKYPNFPGLNLSFEVREGLIKHTTPWDNPQTEGLEGFKSIEAQVCNIADEIAYNNHDLDDGLRAGLLTENALCANITLWREAKKVIQSQYVNVTEMQLITLINSHIISEQVDDVLAHTEMSLKKESIQSVDQIQSYKKPFVSFSKEMFEKNKELRNYLFAHFYSHIDVYRMNKKGQSIIRNLFNAFMADAKLMPDTYRKRIANHEKNQSKERIICDYIAGMTDTFAKKEYQEIFM